MSLPRGETSLAQATLDALLEKRKLLVAVDEPTGRLLGSLLQPLPHSEAVFDFGTESYADPQKSRRITVPEQLLRRFPRHCAGRSGPCAGRAAGHGRGLRCRLHARQRRAVPFVLVCDRRGAAACALPPDMNDTFIGNQILDLLRRRLFGLQLTDSCITFRPGHDRPLLVVSEAARSRGNTVRFSLRRRTPPTRDADHTADFEPMLDFDRPAPVSPPSFPQPEQSAAPDPAAPHRTLHRRDAAATPPEVSEPTGVIRFETDADAQAAAPEPARTSGPEAPRHARIRRARPVEPPAPPDEAPLPDVPQGRAPAPSVLDDDIPDFSADLDPAAIAAAQAADDAAEAAGKSASVEDFTRAATQLFDASAVEEAAAEKAAQKTDKKRRRKAEKPESGPVQPSIKNRSLEIIEKSAAAADAPLFWGLSCWRWCLCWAAGRCGCSCAAIWAHAPRPKLRHGALRYDRRELPGQGAGAPPRRRRLSGLARAERRTGLRRRHARPGNARERREAPSIVRFATPSALDAATPGNTVVECTGSDYKALADEDTLKQNSGFTLYTAGGVYRFKAIAVYYFDPSEQGAGAFDLYGSTDLSSYYDYLTFVAGIQARSLFDTGVDVGDDSRFLTVTTHSDESGVLLCITGRLIREGEAELFKHLGHRGSGGAAADGGPV